MFGHMQGVDGLIPRLLYDSGLRVGKALRLRLQDVDFDNLCLHVHFGKGRKDRVTTMPVSLVAPLSQQISGAAMWQAACCSGDFATLYKARLEVPERF